MGCRSYSGAVIVPGLVGDLIANLHTNKVQNANTYQMDFFPVGPFQETHPTGAVHKVTAGRRAGTCVVLACSGWRTLFLGLRRRR